LIKIKSATRKTPDKGLSGPSITNIIEKGRAKEDTINKRLEDSNISNIRREYYK
jgi:hypothetical protein